MRFRPAAAAAPLPVFDLISTSFAGDAGRRGGWIEAKHQAKPKNPNRESEEKLVRCLFF
jgi:hypothetical protein